MVQSSLPPFLGKTLRTNVTGQSRGSTCPGCLDSIKEAGSTSFRTFDSQHTHSKPVSGNKVSSSAFGLSSPAHTYFAIGGPFGHCRPAGTNPFLSRSQAGARSVQVRPRPVPSGDPNNPKSRLFRLRYPKASQGVDGVRPRIKAPHLATTVGEPHSFGVTLRISSPTPLKMANLPPPPPLLFGNVSDQDLDDVAFPSESTQL